MKKPKTAEQMRVVFNKFMDWLQTEDTEVTTEVAKGFNTWLDDLSNTDLFGTEKQCDPRGDQRK